jgi:uncharacterized C2H2 Zn-finger protein
MDINPWQVATIQEFYFLKCPECDFMHKEESDFQNHAVENHPLSVTFFGEVEMTIEKIGIFDDCNEGNESNDALNTVKEEILDTRNDHEMDEQIFPIEDEVKQDNIYDVSSSETVNDICPETHEFHDLVESELSELSEMSRDVGEVREPPTMIPLLTYEYAAAQIAHAIPACESREILNENPTMNNAVRLDFSQQMLTQPSSSNLISPSIVKNGKKKYKCSKCDASFTRRSNLKNHVEVHHEGKNINQCFICDTSFSDSGSLKRHIATVHEGQKPFKCSICDARFTLSGSMNRHIATIHEGQKAFKCHICDTNFTQSASLKTHFATVHEGKKPFKCSICDARFAQNEHLKRHIAVVHEGQKPFKCNICDASFGRNCSLTKHVSTVHENNIETLQID